MAINDIGVQENLTKIQSSKNFLHEMWPSNKVHFLKKKL